tara:strand:- start:3225 stop:3332 length:108 start_codon:yes stop_codon:yes gene_type:complete
MNTIGFLIALKTAVLALVAKKYTLVNKNRIERRIK